ncbi:putative GPI-anchored protein pfl2 [Pogonomyrmex barbatus]|uniref:GPI-anchored protein pfl2 n=1 Tax=Pogonomyrmex barbatus TaxID=144034 RepID=A0A6I9WBB2_9HYME|nr:putative GPI-anchored protein pfl2 [Pogonomyrmex barbatus]
MLPQRLRWLLPVLIMSWMSLQLSAAHNERSHVAADTFDPSAAALTMTRNEDHDGRAHHPPKGKNETQSNHKLVASPAGLLRPDKFQFYTYDDKGDMITRQMTAQEIQGLIAAGGADHIAMDRQEPQKADDVLTGGKKVMDVVQKVQNVLKSALDKPPILTGSIPKIPEHANVEWSNILPSILSGEADAISPNGESNQSFHKIKPQKVETAGASNTGTGVLISKPPTTKKPPATSDVQTNAYAGFTNNMQEKPQPSHHSQQTTTITEKPMIPVPVITLTEQKLSTVQSTVTESPIFQMLSVIPVESVATKGSSTISPMPDISITNSAITQASVQTEESLDQTEQFIELALTKVPEGTTFPQLTTLDMYPVSITKQTTMNNKVGQGIEVSMTTPGVSTDSSTTKLTHNNGPGEMTNAPDKISSSSANYILVQSKNNTKISDDSALASVVTEGSQASGMTHNDDEIIPQINILAIPAPFSHASSRPEEASSNVIAPHSSSTLASVTRIKAPTVPTSSQPFTIISDHYLSEGLSTVTKGSSSSATPAYVEHYLNPLTTEIQSPAPIEPLPTQLIDSFSSVINQVSEVKPPILPLSPNETPEIPIVNINYDQRRNVSGSAEATLDEDTQHDAAVSQGSNEKKNVANAQTYVTVTTEIPSRGTTVRLVDYITHRPLSATNDDVSTNTRVTATTSSSSTRIGITNNGVTANNLVTTPAGLKSTVASKISGSTGSSSSVQFEKIHVTAATESPMILESVAEKIAPSSSIAPDAAATQSMTTSINPSASSNKPTTINEYFDNALTSLNLSDPVSAIDQVLNIAPLPSSIPAIEPIGLPSDTSSLVASGLASGLIAGFTIGSSNEKFSQTAKNTSKLAQESTEDVTKIYEKIAGSNLNDQRKKNVTQSTQGTLIDPVRNGTLIYGVLTQTKESNMAEPTKLSSSSEKVNDPTKAPSSSSGNKFSNTNESKFNIKQSTTNVGITVKPEQTTMTEIRLPSVNKTVLGTSDDQKKTEIREKVKTTEASIVRTDLGPELSQSSSMKIANDTRNTESSMKIEILDEKNDPSANASPTKETITIHNPVPDNSYNAYIGNTTTNTSASNVTSDGTILLNKNSTDPAFSQNPNRVNSTAGYKDKNTSTQNKKNDNNNDSSPLPIQEHTESSIVKIVTQGLTGNVSGTKEDIFRPDNSTSNTSNQNDKNLAQPMSTIGTPTQSDKDNKTESKIASLKHSESSSKPTDATRLPASTSPSSVPIHQTSKPTVNHKPSEKVVTKTDTDANVEDKWTLISQEVPPAMPKLPKPSKPSKPSRKPVQTSSSSPNENTHVRSPGAGETATHHQDHQESPTQSLLPLDASQSAVGLDVTIRHTSPDIINFAKLCNELAFNFWAATNKGLSTARSLALSPFGMTSLLAMIFLGARGPTSDQMNEVLGLDDVATFNPHLVFQNITDTVSLARGQGIVNAAFVRELFADKMKVRKLMPFYKEQAQQFYEGLVAEVNFATISDLVRRRTNLLIRKQTGGRIKDFVKTNTVPLRSPLAALSANVFQTDCNSSLTSSVGRDGELYFAVSPAVRQRKLVPVPATTWRSSVLAGYEPSIDATAVALGNSDKLISTIFVLPGQQGHTAPGDNLDRLEQRLTRSAFRDGAWNKLLKVLIPRSGLELQVPKFSHRSVVNATAALKRMGLDELFSGNADFKGINGIGHRLHLADVLQMNLFSTCGDENILGGRHHVETYPATPLRRSVERRLEETDNSGSVAEEDTSRYVSSQEDNVDLFYADRYGFYREERHLSGSLERPRLKLDRPFLYFVRHNPSGIILHMGRFNPRLLP